MYEKYLPGEEAALGLAALGAVVLLHGVELLATGHAGLGSGCHTLGLGGSTHGTGVGAVGGCTSGKGRGTGRHLYSML